MHGAPAIRIGTGFESTSSVSIHRTRISPVPLYNTHADVLRFAREVECWRTTRSAP